MKTLKLAISLLFLGICVFALAQEDKMPGWRPGMTRAEYEVLKRENIARMNSGLNMVQDLKNGLHYFPLNGKKFVEALSLFAEKIKGEYEIVDTVMITEMSSSVVRGNQVPDSRIDHTVVVGYIVVTKPKY